MSKLKHMLDRLRSGREAMTGDFDPVNLLNPFSPDNPLSPAFAVNQIIQQSQKDRNSPSNVPLAITPLSGPPSKMLAAKLAAAQQALAAAQARLPAPAVQPAAAPTAQPAHAAAAPSSGMPTTAPITLVDPNAPSAPVTVVGARSFAAIMKPPPDRLFGELEEAGIPAGTGTPSLFSPPQQGDFPMLQKLHERFSQAEVSPKIVRIDTEDTYEKFMSDRAAPRLAALADRVLDLEEQFDDHVSDGHGGLDEGDDDDDFGEELSPVAKMSADISKLQSKANYGGDKAEVRLPPWAKGKVRCWQDGDSMCCSIRLPGADGRVRIATTTTSVQGCVTEVLGFARDASVDPLHILGVLPTLTKMLGSASLVPQLAATAGQLLSMPGVSNQTGPVYGVLRSSGDPKLASMMALIQAANRGDGQARTELSRMGRLATAPDGRAVKALMLEAAKRLDGRA